MTEEKHEEHHVHQPEHEKNKGKLPRIKLSRENIIAILILVIFLAILTIPTYLPKGDCEIARPNYKCASAKDVMIENCDYWAKYQCNTNADASLPQIEWYIDNLCNLQNQYHGTGLDCSNLKLACNTITESQVCPMG